MYLLKIQSLKCQYISIIAFMLFKSIQHIRSYSSYLICLKKDIQTSLSYFDNFDARRYQAKFVPNSSWGLLYNRKNEVTLRCQHFCFENQQPYGSQRKPQKCAPPDCTLTGVCLANRFICIHNGFVHCVVMLKSS